jgi:hypothetical protein
VTFARCHHVKTFSGANSAGGALSRWRICGVLPSYTGTSIITFCRF